MVKKKRVDIKKINQEIDDKIREKCLQKELGKKLYIKLYKNFKEKHIVNVMVQNELCKKTTQDKIIKQLVKKETEKIYGRTPKKEILEINSESSDEDDKNYKKWREHNKYKMPTASTKKMTSFLEELSKEKVKVNMYQTHFTLDTCTSRMNVNHKISWNSLICLKKAITHSILHRKWYNLTKLLLILVHWTMHEKYRPIVFMYCEKLLNEYHPLIEESGLKDQFTMILRRKND